MEPLIILAIGLALLFNFVNGLNDAGNSIATVVATRALTPLHALILAAICNVAGPFLLTTAIAKTIGTGIVAPGIFTPLMLAIALTAGVVLVTLFTIRGYPISASHALVGCMMGAAMAAAGPSVVLWPSIQSVISLVSVGLIGAVCGSLYLGIISWLLHGSVRLGLIAGAVGGYALIIPALMVLGMLEVHGLLAILSFIVISPVLGFLGAFFFDLVITYLFRFSRQSRRRRIFLPLQVIAGGMQAVGHGANDGLHAVGIIGAILIAGGLTTEFTTPFWVMIASALAIGAGTVLGGWKVITRMAKSITKIRPYQGFCASTAGGSVVSILTIAGIPSSSSHIISGSIVGVGATRGIRAVDWTTVREIVTTWIVTIPLSSAAAYMLYLIVTTILKIWSP